MERRHRVNVLVSFGGYSTSLHGPCGAPRAGLGEWQDLSARTTPATSGTAAATSRPSTSTRTFCVGSGTKAGITRDPTCELTCVPRSRDSVGPVRVLVGLVPHHPTLPTLRQGSRNSEANIYFNLSTHIRIHAHLRLYEILPLTSFR